MSTIGGFSFEDAAEIKRRVLGNSSLQKPLDDKKQHLGQRDKYYARLEQDMAAATDPLTGYSETQARLVRYIPEQDSLDMEVVEGDTNPPITVVNRSETFTADRYSVIQVHKIGSEWAPIHAAGGANSPADDCPCFCLKVGDVILRDEMVPKHYYVNLPRLVWNLDNVDIVFPGDAALLTTWDPVRQLWVADIGMMLQVFDKSGNDITDSSIIDGEVTISYPENGDPELKVCVTYDEDNFIVYPMGYEAGYQYGSDNGYADGIRNGEYNNTVLFTGQSGTGGGTGSAQNFGTGTILAPGTGTYGDMTGTGTGTGTFMWSNYEEGFYVGYRVGYDVGYHLGLQAFFGSGTGV